MKRNVSAISLVILVGILFFIGCNKNKVTDPAPEPEPTITTTTASKHPTILRIETIDDIAGIYLQGPTEEQITWRTDMPCTAQVLYGTTASYGLQTFEMPINSKLPKDWATDYRIFLTGLQPNTRYHFAVKSTNVMGLTTISEDKTFTTKAYDGTFAAISNITVSDIKRDPNTTGSYVATITWDTDIPGRGWVFYGKDLSYDYQVGYNLPNSTETGNNKKHSVLLLGLIPNTKYYFCVAVHPEGWNSLDDLITSTTQFFVVP